MVLVLIFSSNRSLLSFDWKVGPLPAGKDTLVISALSIKNTNSKALRKLSSRLPSSQETDPCQLAFCRNSTRTANVAHRPSRMSAPGGRPVRSGGSEKLLTAVPSSGKTPSSCEKSLLPKGTDDTICRKECCLDIHPHTQLLSGTHFPRLYPAYRDHLLSLFYESSIACRRYTTGYSFSFLFQFCNIIFPKFVLPFL